MKVLVTGGAGLIGSHIVDLLLEKGYEVRILDNLELPTHYEGKPKYIPGEVEFIKGDMRNEDDLIKALDGIDIISHQAATGGFTPEISKYFDSNSLGTAKMLELILKNKLPIKKIIVASSIAVYGEGKYKCNKHGIQYPKLRPVSQLEKEEWELKCPMCGEIMTPLSTDEDKPIDPGTIYGISKYDQERTCLLFGKNNNLPVIALRYFVTYGPRQSIFNPYTGICSMFSMKILNNKPPIIYEDGNQIRDMIFVKDIAKANLLVMNNEKANYDVFNVGTGRPIKIIDVANTLIKELKSNLSPDITKAFRPGEVRHIIADISKIRKLGFEPEYDFKKGIKEYLDWISSKKI